MPSRRIQHRFRRHALQTGNQSLCGRAGGNQPRTGRERLHSRHCKRARICAAHNPRARGNGQYRLFVGGEIRKKLGVDAGGSIGIALGRDKKPNELAVPADVTLALRKTPGARKAFESVTPGLRREFLRWVLNAKHAETRAKRIARALPILVERARIKSREESP